MTNEDTTRVRVYESDKDRINDRRRGDDGQADVVKRLLDDESEPVAHAEPSVDVPPDVLADALEDAVDVDTEAIADQVAEKIDTTQVSPEDVTNAVERGVENALSEVR